MIKLTTHAKRRMMERTLYPAWIEADIMIPDRTEPDADPALTHSFKAIGACGGRVLKVIHRQDGTDILVVTAHFDREAER